MDLKTISQQMGWISLTIISQLLNCIPGQGQLPSISAHTRIQSEILAPQVANQPQALIVDSLSDGDYQVCSQPAPQNWQDGAGVCFRFQKSGQHVEGYYGYPHTDDFVCLRGSVQGNYLSGEAFATSWEGAAWQSVPPTEFQWDTEGRLTLSQAEQLLADQTQAGWTSKILFHSAQLNLQDFYAYPQPRMKPSTELCTWSSQ